MILHQNSQADNNILTTAEEYKVVDTHLIHYLHFPTKSGFRMAQQHLQKLYKKGKLNRQPLGKSYAYGLDKLGRAEHTLALNWVRLWIQNNPRKYHKVHSFKYEDDYKFLRTDAFLVQKNYVTGDFYFSFIEIDISLRNAFDKVVKYNRLYDEFESLNKWWCKLAKGFPDILIVTTTETRKEKILQHIAEENKNNLNFKVLLLSDIKEELK